VLQAISIPTYEVRVVEAIVCCIDTSSMECNIYKIKGGAKRYTGSAASLDSSVEILQEDISGVTGVSFALNLNELRLRAAGKVAQNLEWRARVCEQSINTD
jgi:hypothetical protein